MQVNLGLIGVNFRMLSITLGENRMNFANGSLPVSGSRERIVKLCPGPWVGIND